MYRTEYLAFIDLDEFIVPRGTSKTWDDLFHALNKQLIDKENTCAFSFLKNQFYTNGIKKSKEKLNLEEVTYTKSLKLLNKDWDTILGSLVSTTNIASLVAKNDIKSMMTFIRDKDTDSGALNKMIVIPRKVGALDVHHVEFPINSEKAFYVHNETATVHHYRLPSIQSYYRTSLGEKFLNLFRGLDHHLTTDKTMVKYAEELVKRVEVTTRLFNQWKLYIK